MSQQQFALLAEAKRLAKAYRALTGRPLGLTGEVAEYEAARILQLELSEVRQAGYDAVRRVNGHIQRLQIKGRCILPTSKPSQRIGSIKLDHEWDAVILVLLDEDYEATAIYEAPRTTIERALKKPGSRARNERGALGVNQFKRLGRCIWQGSEPGAT